MFLTLSTARRVAIVFPPHRLLRANPVPCIRCRLCYLCVHCACNFDIRMSAVGGHGRELPGGFPDQRREKGGGTFTHPALGYLRRNSAQSERANRTRGRRLAGGGRNGLGFLGLKGAAVQRPPPRQKHTVGAQKPILAGEPSRRGIWGWAKRKERKTPPLLSWFRNHSLQPADVGFRFRLYAVCVRGVWCRR